MMYPSVCVVFFFFWFSPVVNTVAAEAVEPKRNCGFFQFKTHESAVWPSVEVISDES